MVNKVSSQYNVSKIINSEHNILDFLQFKSKLKKDDFTTLELVNGSILSLVGQNIHQLNEFTVASIAINFSLYINKNKEKHKNENVLITHDGSLDGLLFAKIFASVLLNEDINAYFNYDNKPLNNPLAIYTAQKSKIKFKYVVTFTNQIQKHFHCITFFHINGLHFDSLESKQINALISETNFLNLEIPNNNIPTIKEDRLIERYLKDHKVYQNYEKMNIMISDPFQFNSHLIKEMLDQQTNLQFIK